MSATNTKKYYYGIDIARIVAAIIAVAVHTDPLMTYTETGNYFINTVVGRLVVPYFFIVSGFFFGRKMVFNEPVKTDFHFLVAFLRKILLIYVVWTLIYLPFQFVEWLKSGDSWSYWIVYIQEAVFKGSYYPLWYLTGLLFATAFSYLLYKLMKPKMVLGFTFTLFLIGIMMNSYYHVLHLDGLFETYYELFLTTRNGLFFGSFFVSLGMYLSKREAPQSIKWNASLFIISLVLLTIEVFSLRGTGFSRGLDMWFFAIPTTYFLFRWLQQLDLKKRAIYAYFRPLSLLIYVSHGLFIIQFKYLLEVNSLFYFAVVLCGTTLLSMFILLASKRWSMFRNLY